LEERSLSWACVPAPAAARTTGNSGKNDQTRALRDVTVKFDVSTGMPETYTRKEDKEKTGRSFLGSPPLGWLVSVLVVELERKLNLARIVRRVAVEPINPKFEFLKSAAPISRPTPLPPNPGALKVRMIQNVEDFRIGTAGGIFP